MEKIKLFNKRNKVLLKELVITEFKLRYQGSFLGYLWSILKPMLLFSIIYLVFARFLRFGSDIPHFAVGMLLGTVVWNFLSEATSMGMSSIVSRGDLLRKVSFPKYIVVVSAIINALINFGINLIVVLIFGLVSGVFLGWNIIFLPVLIIELFALSLGLALLLSTIFVKFRDIAPVWEVLLQAGFYATPIIYPITMIISVHPRVAQVSMLNPMAQIIQDLRYILTSHANLTVWQFYSNRLLPFIPIIIVIAVLLVGIIVFMKNSNEFAENI